jgi:hypothetical protein
MQELGRQAPTGRDQEMLKWERRKFAALPVLMTGIMFWAESEVRHLPWLAWPGYMILGVGAVLAILAGYNIARLRSGL